MAEDCVNHAITLGKLPDNPCITKTLRIHGYRENIEDIGSLWVYGADAEAVQSLAKDNSSLAQPLHPDLPYCGTEVIWGVRKEMARTVDDILSRRTRALFLNARAAIEMAPAVAKLMASELDRDEGWIQDQIASFKHLAEGYLLQ
jgi:glycerol-3-phosphate dehydrogenase